MQKKEHVEAVHFMQAIRSLELKWPCLKWLHHVPNGGARHYAVGGQLKAEGVKAGVADYFLPWPMPLTEFDRDQFHGLYLELKAEGGRLTANQKEFLRDMAAAGYAVAVAFGRYEATECVINYLEGKHENPAP